LWQGAVRPVGDAKIIGLRQIGRPAGRTITVRLRAAASRFTFWVDDQQVDTWQDSRLLTGGFGFVGTPQDRARIYWVKLSSTGEPAKE